MRLDAPDRLGCGFEDDMLEASGGLADRNYFRALAENAVPTIGWLQAHGVEFTIPIYYLSAARPVSSRLAAARPSLKSFATPQKALG